MTSLLRSYVCLISVLIKAALIILFKSHYAIIFNTMNQSDLFDPNLLVVLSFFTILSDHLRLTLTAALSICFLGFLITIRVTSSNSICLLCCLMRFSYCWYGLLRSLTVIDSSTGAISSCGIDNAPRGESGRCLRWRLGRLVVGEGLVFVSGRWLCSWWLSLDHKLLGHPIICISSCTIISLTLFLFADLLIILEKCRLSILVLSSGQCRRI